MAGTKHSQESLDTAKSMYMDNIPIVEISKEMNIPRPTIQYYVKKSWQRERDLFNSRLIKATHNGTLDDLIDIATNSRKVIRRALATLATRKTPPTVQEAVQVSKIHKDLHEIATKLQEKSDEPIDLNPEEALQEIQNDPFLGGSIENN